MINQPTHINRKSKHTFKFWAGILFAQFLLFYILSKSVFFIKLNSSFFEIQKQLHQQLFSFGSISFGDIFYTLIISAVIILTVLFLISRKKKFLIIILIGLNVIYPLYQIFWGLLYFQKPILEISDQNNITEQKLLKLANKLLDNCIALRENLHENKDGIFEITSIETIARDVIEAQNNLPAKYHNKKTTSVQSIKSSIYSPFMNYTGILGYYNPFTAEAQYNSNLPSTKLPITIAHETAHQLGYAPEQEASFIGYLICEKSNNEDLQYSANYYALQSVLNALSKTNEELALSIREKYSVGMRNDRKNEIFFNEKYKGQLTNIFSFTNDLFLKYNQQEGSVTYSYFVNLLVLHEDYK